VVEEHLGPLPQHLALELLVDGAQQVALAVEVVVERPRRAAPISAPWIASGRKAPMSTPYLDWQAGLDQMGLA
jgi:hypothetical protein